MVDYALDQVLRLIELAQWRKSNGDTVGALRTLNDAKTLVDIRCKSHSFTSELSVAANSVQELLLSIGTIDGA